MQESVRIPASRSRANCLAPLARLLLSVTLALFCAACVRTPPREITELVVQDSTYLDPETMLPYSGPVFRNFPGEDGGTQLDAMLRDGTWEGEFTIYHETGRVRYEGEMSGGAQCGAWIENENSVEPESAYEAIKEDLESLVIYPDCPEG